MNIKRSAASIVVASLSLAPAGSFSPTKFTDNTRCGHHHHLTSLAYKNYDGPHLFDVDGDRIAISETPPVAASPTTSRRIKAVTTPRDIKVSDKASHLFDVDSDRTSLRTLLDPPAPPFIPLKKKSEVVLQTPEARQAALRSATKENAVAQKQSPITSLYTIQDYQDKVLSSSLNNEHELCIIRFKAPWCQTCRTTNVAWERMASRLAKLSSSSPKNKIKFFAVELDGKEETTALKDMLNIEGVPQGVLHHPTLGISEQRVKLHRKNLSTLKKNLERFVTFTRGEDGLQSGMLLDGLKEDE